MTQTLVCSICKKHPEVKFYSDVGDGWWYANCHHARRSLPRPRAWDIELSIIADTQYEAIIAWNREILKKVNK